MINLGMVGFGNFGRQLAKGFADTGFCRLRTIAVGDPARHSGQPAFGAVFCDDYRTILRDNAIDAVAVAGPLQMQAGLVEEVLAAGKHVFMEKPLAPTLEDALRIKAAADASDKVAMVGFIERFNPALLRVKALLRNEYLGRLFRLSIKRGSRNSDRTPWMWEVGMFVHILGHNIDIFRWFLEDEVEHVFAESDSYMRRRPGEDDNICAILRFRNGALGVMEDSWTLSPSMLMEENDTRMDLIGEKGNLSFNGLNQMLSLYNEKGVFYPGLLRWPGGLTEESGLTSYALRDECLHFIRCVENPGTLPVSTVDSALENLRVALACRLSAREGRRVYLSEIA